MSGPKIAGTDLKQLQSVSAGMGTYAGARLVKLEDGVERGIRVVEMRSGGGLDFEIIVDRSGDIGRLSCNGQTLSWHSPSGLTSPWLMDHEGDNGQGFLRGFGGFLNTCGLDHIRQPETDSAERVDQDILQTQKYPLHGKGAFQPSTIRGYGLVDDVPEPFVFCEIEFVQSMSFVSSLRLRRRFELPVGSKKLTIKDVVRNVGSNPTTHMLLYHFNLGFPLTAAGTQVDFGNDDCVWKSQDHDPLEPFPEPQTDAGNQISIFKHASDEGRAVVNSAAAGLELELEYPSSQLPYCQLLRMTGEGVYGIGIEPCTAQGRSRAEARENGDMIVLKPGEERQYSLALKISQTETEGR